jgi:hypothetical protein
MSEVHEWQLAKLRQLAETATPGPWEWHDGGIRSIPTGEMVLWPDNVVRGPKTPGDHMGASGAHAEAHSEVNALFLAYANPEAVKTLFRAIETARAEGKADGYAAAREQAAMVADSEAVSDERTQAQKAAASRARSIAQRIRAMQPEKTT